MKIEVQQAGQMITFAAMKIAYSWLKQLLPVDLPVERVSEILTSIGLEVESVEKVQSIPGGLQGLVIGHVLERIQHPNADRLSVTKVDLGNGEPVQIVCGAPNVAAGQKVVVAPVGCTVYPLSGEPFKITKAKIRGEVSEGMICAEDEIGLGKSHDGILVLPQETKVGIWAVEHFQLEDEAVLEIGLTPNRADAASHLGVARDLAAYLAAHDLGSIKPSLTDVAAFPKESANPISVEVLDTEACPRYSGVCIDGVTVADSPEWLQTKLKSIGLKPINNVVDVTNYVLHELGQPLHAFDAAKIKGGKVLVKTLPENTPFKTLDGVDRKLSAQDLMICNGSGEGMCVAGVFGGMESGVSAQTTSIFLESAYFNSVSVRKTARRHGLKTDASFRFERGTDPEMTVYALKRAALLICEVAGGKISSAIIDHYPNPVQPFSFEVNYSYINRLIGKEIPAVTVKKILLGLGITIIKETTTSLSLQVPAFKVDVTREADIVEEVLRIYGFNSVEMPGQMRSSLSFATKPNVEKVQDAIADLLVSNGFVEIMTNSLTKGSYDTLVEDASANVKVLNPLSIDLDTMRSNMLFSMLEAVNYNHNRKQKDLRLFEFGKVYQQKEEGYSESKVLTMLVTGQRLQEQWNSGKEEVGVYLLKGILQSLLQRLGISGLEQQTLSNKQYTQGLSFLKNGKVLATAGSIQPSLLKQFDISGPLAYVELNWGDVLKVLRKAKDLQYKEVSKFPAVRRDLSMLIATEQSFEQLQKIAFEQERKLLKTVNVFDVYTGDKLPAGKKSYAMSFMLEDTEKTLTDQQIDAVMNKLIAAYEKAGAEVRKS